MYESLTFLLSTLVTICTLPGTIELLFLTVGAQLYKKTAARKQTRGGKLAVIIPAHNEAASIKKTIESLKKQEGRFDIVVVADNCTDDTAQIALSQKVKVFERNDPLKRGKPWALNYIFCILMKKQDYDWFVIVDADTIVESNFIKEVTDAFSEGHQAIQTRYEVLSPDASIRHRLMSVAFSASNYLRPLGRSYWNLSCGILGNGFGITKETLQNVPIPVDSVVEDLSYHIMLVEQGYKVAFIPTTCVYGEMPTSKEGIAIQRIRWEGGRFIEIGKVPSLLVKIFKGNVRLIEPALDLLLLPLAYHVLLLFLLLLISNSFAMLYSLFALAVVGYHLFVSVYLGKRGYKDLLALLAVPFYLIWKIGILFKTSFAVLMGLQWQKTDRTNAPQNSLSQLFLWVALGIAVCLGLLWLIH